jgi:hypothetical protein
MYAQKLFFGRRELPRPAIRKNSGRRQQEHTHLATAPFMIRSKSLSLFMMRKSLVFFGEHSRQEMM